MYYHKGIGGRGRAAKAPPPLTKKEEDILPKEVSGQLFNPVFYPSIFHKGRDWEVKGTKKRKIRKEKKAKQKRAIINCFCLAYSSNVEYKRSRIQKK